LHYGGTLRVHAEIKARSGGGGGIGPAAVMTDIEFHERFVLKCVDGKNTACRQSTATVYSEAAVADERSQRRFFFLSQLRRDEINFCSTVFQ